MHKRREQHSVQTFRRSTGLEFPHFLILALFAAVSAPAQTRPQQIKPLLEAPLLAPEVVSYQVGNYLMERVPRLTLPSSREEWDRQKKTMRREMLETIFRGWPREWVEAPLKVEDLGLVPSSGSGYRIRKLRYEIVPGFYSAALLYEPENMQGRVPAMLNVNGHIYGLGKEIEYKQKRCINQAKQGMLALNLEWLYFGELIHEENQHWFGSHLDLVGAHGMGLFYLAMRKGLDYLDQHPNVDRGRIGMTGLSGGGWQTILLSALDERVAAAVPVAGHSSLVSRFGRMDSGDLGDFEQQGSDQLSKYEYTHFTAMLAPRPLLLIHNADDIFQSNLVKPLLFDQLRPIWKLYDGQDRFAFHENSDPADHNYQLDNRLQAYRFFAKHLGLPAVDAEVPVGSELKDAKELTVGLPADNLTMLGLAKRLAKRIERSPAPADASARREWAERERAKLTETVRYREATVQRAWLLTGTRRKGLETRSYRFDFSNGLSASGVWLQAMDERHNDQATVVLHDEGRQAASREVADRVNRGEPVLALDLIFTGDSSLPEGRPERVIQFLASVGDRPLGIEVAQLIAAAQWLRSDSGAAKLRLETSGMRSQIAALTAAALTPELFSELVVRDGIDSLQYLLDKPVEQPKASDLFCLGLYKEFDLDRLAALAGIPIERGDNP